MDLTLSVNTATTTWVCTSGMVLWSSAIVVIASLRSSSHTSCLMDMDMDSRLLRDNLRVPSIHPTVAFLLSSDFHDSSTDQYDPMPSAYHKSSLHSVFLSVFQRALRSEVVSSGPSSYKMVIRIRTHPSRSRVALRPSRWLPRSYDFLYYSSRRCISEIRISFVFRNWMA